MTKTLVELKAQIPDRESVRGLLVNNGGEYVGRYHQVDTYFKVPKGRLKVRELVGLDKAHLIFYEREDVRDPKESRVWKVNIQDPESMKELLSQIFPVCAVVDKNREIYMFDGVQVHLDRVEGLGEFLELEKEVSDEPGAILEGRRKLESLLERLDVNVKNLLSRSYCDMIMEGKAVK
ncbi:MAG: class IV adenylate cyclase [Candidatus Bathyarchaeia archaeon]